MPTDDTCTCAHIITRSRLMLHMLPDCFSTLYLSHVSHHTMKCEQTACLFIHRLHKPNMQAGQGGQRTQKTAAYISSMFQLQTMRRLRRISPQLSCNLDTLKG
jgi:hypothetical protein